MQLEFLFPRKKNKPDLAGVKGKNEISNRDEELTSQCVEALELLGIDRLASQVQVVWNKR